jgi:hypothetical protein
MITFMQAVILAAFLLCVLLPPISRPLTQKCGFGYTTATVTDAEGKGIPDVTVELIAEMPYEEYDKYWRDKDAIKNPNGWRPLKFLV